MKRAISLILLGFSFAIGITAFAAEHKSAITPNAAFDKMKSLDGSWTGSMVDGGQEYPATARFKIVSDGSAVMGWLGEGSPYEMVTVFHTDGPDLMATHYCAAHNQPRFIAVPDSNPNRIVFKFKDGTNIGPHDGHMQEVTFTFDGADHHTEDWASVDVKGVVIVGHFVFTRKK